MEMDDGKDSAPCTVCRQLIQLSVAPRRPRTGVPVWVRCSFCMDVYHSRCADVPSRCSRIGFYDWECDQCRRCMICHELEAEGMMFCDGCDRGCHGHCLNPPVNVTEGDETPFLCKDCIEAKHTTRGFRRTKILGGEARKQLLIRVSPKKKKITRPRKIRQRHSESLEPENDSSSAEEEEKHHGDPLPSMCVARGCDGSGHLDGETAKHTSLETCPVYNRIPLDKAQVYTEVINNEKSTPSKRKTVKGSREMLDAISTIANVRMTESVPKQRNGKPVDVYVAPEIKGVSSFGKTLFEMAKVRNAMFPDPLELPTSSTPASSKSQRFIEFIQIGKYVIDVKEMSATSRDEPLKKQAFFCDVCMEIYHEKTQFDRHMSGCAVEHPPGMEVYSKGDLAIYEIDGRLHKEFCQNLSLLSRFFLSTKAVCYDVIYMMYYVLGQKGADGRYRPVGYFSKDKDLEKNTLACILVLPHFAHQGFGKLLIDLRNTASSTAKKGHDARQYGFKRKTYGEGTHPQELLRSFASTGQNILISNGYVISRTTRKPGTPERPLSKPGLLAFISYWQCAVAQALLDCWHFVGQYAGLLDELSAHLGMATEDIEDTLTRLDLIKTDPKSKKLMVLKEPAKMRLQEIVKKKDELRKIGKLIDPNCVHKPWLKLLTTRKKIE